MQSGNESDKVQYTWEPAGGVVVRRAPPPQQQGQRWPTRLTII